MMRGIIGVALALFLTGTVSGVQDAKKLKHTSSRPQKCRKCWVAYESAFSYLRKEEGKISFPAKMVYAWLLLADGRYPKELQNVAKEATQWDSKMGRSQHAQNWYPALAGFFLVEYHKFYPTQDTLDAIQKIVKWFAEHQERTGGWFKWHEGAYKDRLDYPVKDLGFLTAMVYSILWSAKAHKIKVPAETLKKATECLDTNTTSTGISYGTGQKGRDKTGARGGMCIQGLVFARQTSHKIYKTYVKHLPKVLENLDQGHHVGAFHCLGVTLGCRTLGPKVYQQLTGLWLDKLIDKQKEDGSVYVGDDEDAGGEIGLLRGNHGSTAAFALMILLQDQTKLRKGKKKSRKKKGGIFGDREDTPTGDDDD